MTLDEQLRQFTESYIREHEYHTNWTLESEWEGFSVDFMRQFRDKIDWKTFFEHGYLKTLPRKFLDEMGIEYDERETVVFITLKNHYGPIASQIKLY